MAWRRERRRNRFSHVLPSSSIAACAGDAGEAVSSLSDGAGRMLSGGSVRHGTRGPVPFAVSCGAQIKRRFRSPSAEVAAFAPARRCCPGAGSVRRQLRQLPVPRHGDRAEGAWPRPLHSPALRQPRPPLRGSLAHARFPGTGRYSLLLTAPFRRRPVGSSRNRALPRRTRMALPPAAALFSLCCFFMAGSSAPELQASLLLRMKK